MAFRFEVGPPRNKSRLRAVLGGVVCIGLCATGLYVLLGGAEMAGGIPLIPDAVNRGIGRILLVLGILITGAMAVYAFREAWQLHRHKNQD